MPINLKFPINVKLSLYNKEHDTLIALSTLLFRKGFGTNGTDYTIKKIKELGSGIYDIQLKNEIQASMLQEYGKIIEYRKLNNKLQMD